MVVTIAAVRYERVMIGICLYHSSTAWAIPCQFFLFFFSSLSNNSASEITRNTNTHPKLNLYYWLENFWVFDKYRRLNCYREREREREKEKKKWGNVKKNNGPGNLTRIWILLSLSLRCSSNWQVYWKWHALANQRESVLHEPIACFVKTGLVIFLIVLGFGPRLC